MISVRSKRIALRIGFLLCIGIGVLFAVMYIREESHEARCISRLGQIGIIIRNYVDRNHSVPPAVTYDSQNRPLHSWRTLLLPFMEGGDEYFRQVDLTEPWNSPKNLAVFTKMPWHIGATYRVDHNLEKTDIAQFVAVTANTKGAATILYSNQSPTKIAIVELARSDILWYEPRDITISPSDRNWQALKSRNSYCFLTTDTRVGRMKKWYCEFYDKNANWFND